MTELTGITSSLTSTLVLRALDASSLQHAALAQNVANASVPGYQRVQVDFESQLAAARQRLLMRDDEQSAAREVAAMHPEIEPDGQAAGKQVELDREISRMMQNAVYYQALLGALGKNSAILRAAVREGRG